MFKAYKIRKKDSMPMGDIMKLFVKRNGLAPGLNTSLVFAAWDKVSGVGPYTLRKFYRDGVLYCTLSSSVVRSRLFPWREGLKEGINRELSSNPLFDASRGLVKSIVLK